MLYNLEKDKIQKPSQCLGCRFFSETGKCCGYGKKCFEYNPITKTLIDQTTKLPLSASAIKTIKSKIESEE